MLEAISLFLFVSALTGLLVIGAQLFTVRSYLRRHAKAPGPKHHPPISILKPLCGIDDDLAANLERFATFSYPNYELLLGVQSPSDPAWEVAQSCARRYPSVVRVVLQRGAPGQNPKVNQLITLEREARHAILLISDSNVRPREGYLEGIAARLEDPGVGLVTHPIVGIGERRLGSVFDNLHLVTSCALGTISAKALAGKDVVVGKSMAMRRSDLHRMGGFDSVKNVLAEDYVLGKAVGEVLGKEVALGGPIDNVSEDRSLGHFISRNQRWSVLQRKMVGLLPYCAQLLLNPILLALIAFLFSPKSVSLDLFVLVVCAKVGMDAMSGWLFRGGFPVYALALIPMKDLVVGWAWLEGLIRDTVEWRGNRLVVLPGTRLAPLADERVDEPVGAGA